MKVGVRETKKVGERERKSIDAVLKTDDRPIERLFSTLFK